MDILIQSLDRKLMAPLLGCKSAAQMWKQILLHYDKSVADTVHTLQKMYYDIKPSATTRVRAFLAEVDNINNQIHDLNPDRVFDEEAVMSKIISSLPSVYNAFRSAWDSVSKRKRTLDTLKNCLIKEEIQLKQSCESPDTHAFYSTTRSQTPRSGSSGSSGNNGVTGKPASTKTNPNTQRSTSAT